MSFYHLKRISVIGVGFPKPRVNLVNCPAVMVNAFESVK